MAFLGKEIDVDSVPESDYTPIPEGEYHLKIDDCELKESRNGGNYIKLSYSVIGPTHQGRKVFGMITVNNANQKAEEIGAQQLASLARAIGLKKVSDTDQLIGGDFLGRVGIRPASEDGKYDAQNEVKKFRALDNSSPLPKPAPTQSAPQPEPAAKGPAPWAR